MMVIGYHNILLPIIVENSISQPLIATIHHHLTETGEMMGIAWQFKFNNEQKKPYFVLIHSDENEERSSILAKNIQNLPQPLDVWLVNFEQEINLDKCVFDSKLLPPVNGYKYQHLRCSFNP